MSDHSSRFIRAGIVSFVAACVGISANLLSGILVARSLGAVGRGALTSTQVAPLLAGWVFSGGVMPALAHHLAARRLPRGEVLGAWMTILVPLALGSTVVVFLAVPVLLSAQNEHTVHLARLVALTTASSVLAEMLWGFLLGEHRFLAYNVVRTAPALLIASSYAGLALAGQLSLNHALVAAVGANLVPVAFLAPLLARERPLSASAPSFKATVGYGLRAHGTTLGEVISARLDLLLLPAFVHSSGVGYYSVATNVSSLLITVAGAVSPLVLPAATRDLARSGAVLRIALCSTALAAAGLGLALELVARFGVLGIYGPSFLPAVMMVRVLVPGTILFVLARVLIGNVLAAGRPLAASLCQMIGVLVTIFGLVVFLPKYGVGSAAWVSTASYGAVFVSSLVVHERISKLGWRTYLPTTTELLSVPRSVRRVLDVGMSRTQLALERESKAVEKP